MIGALHQSFWPSTPKRRFSCSTDCPWPRELITGPDGYAFCPIRSVVACHVLQAPSQSPDGSDRATVRLADVRLAAA
jgi:hypothetical protein